MQEPTHEDVAQLCLRHQEIATTGSGAGKALILLSDAWPHLYLEVRLTVTAEDSVVSAVILQAAFPLSSPVQKSELLA